MFLYKYVLNDEIIYIGKTKRDVNLRIREHFNTMDLPLNAQVYVCKCRSEAYMNAMEILLIDKYRPKYNKDCNPISWDNAEITFTEPAFIKLEEYNKLNMPCEYSRDKKGNIVAWMSDGSSRKPQYCNCVPPVPVKQFNGDGYIYDVCQKCNCLIRDTFVDINIY